MKTIIKYIPAAIYLLPFVSLAQEVGAGPATFNKSYTLWIAIIIGIIASLMVLSNAQKLGGTIAKVLWLFGIGMLFVVVGFLSVVIVWAPEGTQKIVHDFLFILGYVLMAIGGSRLYRLSRNS